MQEVHLHDLLWQPNGKSFKSSRDAGVYCWKGMNPLRFSSDLTADLFVLATKDIESGSLIHFFKQKGKTIIAVDARQLNSKKLQLLLPVIDRMKRQKRFIWISLPPTVSKKQPLLKPLLKLKSAWPGPLIKLGDQAQDKQADWKWMTQAQVPVPDWISLQKNNTIQIQHFTEKHQGLVTLKGQRHFVTGMNNKKIAKGYKAMPLGIKLTSTTLKKITKATWIQQLIEKKSDVRVVVFAGQVLSFELTHSDRPWDWRTASVEKLNVRQIKTPAKIKKACLDLLMARKLKFATIDFVISKNSRKSSSQWFFLEINRPGRWFFLEALSGYPLTDHICFHWDRSLRLK